MKHGGYNTGLVVSIEHNVCEMTTILNVRYCIPHSTGEVLFDIEVPDDKIETLAPEIVTRLMLLGHWEGGLE